MCRTASHIDTSPRAARASCWGKAAAIGEKVDAAPWLCGLRPVEVHGSPPRRAGWRAPLGLPSVHQVLHQTDLLVRLAVDWRGLDVTVLQLRQQVRNGSAPIIRGPFLGIGLCEVSRGQEMRMSEDCTMA